MTDTAIKAPLRAASRGFIVRMPNGRLTRTFTLVLGCLLLLVAVLIGSASGAYGIAADRLPASRRKKSRRRVTNRRGAEYKNKGWEARL